ncbi:unnamed protein product [Phaedon cochleariae]|uniref:Myb/SANT-like DNA-binding domain-containing protein n=1 Tax=Phaedon cochleariae TaxID=80249 RepID=A0A9P0DSG6_PHACE|nr:unnamed protein product [Phaedon cochleariae]
MEKISLYDPETDTSVEVLLSKEDATRVQTDMEFATLLMNSALQEQRAVSTVSVAEQNMETQNAEPDEPDEQKKCIATNEVESEADKGSLYRWSAPCILLLLETYRDMEDKFSNGKYSQKKCYIATGPQCAAKLRSLKKTYKAIKDHNNKSGNDRKTWQYFNIMDDIFSKKAWCMPVAVASSSGISLVNGVSDQKSHSSITPGPSNSGKISATTLLQKRMKQKEQHEDAKQKRHNEKIKMDQQLLDILQKFVEKEK